MPPPSRDNASLDPTSRGSRYLSCASSTCSLPSRVRARRAKMSRISCVRSMTLRSSRLCSSRSCAGDNSLSKIDDVDVGFGGRLRQHVDFAAAEKRRRIGLRAILQHAQHHARAGGVGESCQFFERMFGVDPPRAAGDQTNQRGPLHEHGTPASRSTGKP